MQIEESTAEIDYAAIARLCIRGAKIVEKLQREVTVISPGKEKSAREALDNSARPHSVKRFRYGYLGRLIDDQDISIVPDECRKLTRRIHMECYWKNLSLLNRDSKIIHKAYRELMARRNDWDFAELIAARTSLVKLIWTLRIAGVMHYFHLPEPHALVRSVVAEMAQAMTRMGEQIKAAATLPDSSAICA